METKDGIEAVIAKNRNEWRKWLRKNSPASTKVFLVLYHKRSNVASVNYNDAVEEALCFGWIDSRANKRDEQSYYLTFTPRSRKSKWSKPNHERVARLLENGLMTEHGQKMIDLAKATGKWEIVD
jgi:uncharacterized protein YdeI (YjbR/CyaY-like superfamily)